MSTKKTKPSEIHIRVTHAPLIATFSSPEVSTQTALRTEAKALAAKYLKKWAAPEMKSDSWADAQVDILSEETVRYIDDLESLLEEVLSDADADEEFVARIESILH